MTNDNFSFHKTNKAKTLHINTPPTTKSECTQSTQSPVVYVPYTGPIVKVVPMIVPVPYIVTPSQDDPQLCRAALGRVPPDQVIF